MALDSAAAVSEAGGSLAHPWRFRGWSPAHGVFLACAGLLGWGAGPAVGYRDAGELGLAGLALGVPHPTGFVLDVLWLRTIAYLPLGNLAFRQNLGTALVAAGAVAALCACMLRLLRLAGVTDIGARTPAAMLLAAGLLGWRTFWSTAVAVEVYATGLLLVALAGLAALSPVRARGLIVPLVALTLGAHVTSSLFVGLLAAVATVAVVPPRGWNAALRHTLVRLPAAAACAAVVVYLPLASRRNPPLDWGNPETLGRLVDHLSAARVRLAYGAQMAPSDGSASLAFAQQLSELGWVVAVPAVVGVMMGMRSLPRATLVVAALFAFDVVYAVTINPMGVVDRQVGHVAGAAACLLAGLGVGFSCSHLTGRIAPGVGWLGALGLAGLALAPTLPEALGEPEYGADELYGAGGCLATAAPRSVLLGWSDTQVGAGLFALYGEQARPDMTVVPAQHLWDAQYQARLQGLLDGVAPADDLDPHKGAVADRAMVVLSESGLPRPVLWESPDPLRRVGRAQGLRLATGSTWYSPPTAGGSGPPRAPNTRTWRPQLDALSAPRRGHRWSSDTRRAWGRTYRLAAEQSLGLGAPEDARLLVARALELAPQEPAGWVALGAIEATLGRALGAIQATQRALAESPTNVTAWVNLIRFARASGQAERARAFLLETEKLGLRDPRLDALKGQMEQEAAVP